jgi:tetratricopeptide (TPR) repeat protein
MKAGDVLIHQRSDGYWTTTRILVIDRWEDGSETFHCRLYKPTQDKPSVDALSSLPLLAMHAPIAAEGYKHTHQILCSFPVADEELEGFHEYLRQTDFARYAEVTRQDIHALVSEANSHYQAALALGDSGKPQEAIDAYTKAIDLFPLFFEAMDNRGLTYMELGDWNTAVHDFEQSLRVHRDGHVAFFSRGECLLKMGDLDQAKIVFQEGASRFAEHRETYLRFLDIAQLTKIKDARASGKSENDTITPSKGRTSRWRFWQR